METKWTYLTPKEFGEYIGLGKTKTYEIMSDPDNHFVARIGKKYFVIKELFDKEMEKRALKK
ncbi:hypothetical protein OBO34_11365 [Clostridiales Family XIII bacterium ASD5510]|uniref:Helix-turn-helix domain-containing protein n=1 Tax=Hominibacterium faecale TaxID=2839743 RepID=A0A9J6QV15_9FIRM|nr:hypothetical protein [Hominibacterium faecale]MCU7378955.1 hypothetical protein [Hominibacterium faecale]